MTIDLRGAPSKDAVEAAYADSMGAAEAALGAVPEPLREGRLEEVVHATGFLGWGPPTMCGQPATFRDICGEVTCPRCVSILSDREAFLERVQELEAKVGPAPSVPCGEREP